jgi:hypothetical protein
MSDKNIVYRDFESGLVPHQETAAACDGTRMVGFYLERRNPTIRVVRLRRTCSWWAT